MKFQKIPIGKVEKWLVNEAKEVGLDIDGFEHEITNEFVTHVMNRHGNEKVETAIGQVAVKEDDFKKIPDIVKSPDYVMVGGKYTEGKSKDKDFLAYAKKLDDGTTLFFEVVLDGKKNRALRGKTMYKRKEGVDEQKFLNIVSNADSVDISNAKTISLAATGGYPGLSPTIKESGVVANPTRTEGLSNSNIPQSREKSSEIEIARKAGYVQGVCECVAVIGYDHTLGKKLLSEMNVTRDMAKKFANPETYKTLEKGIFEQKQDQNIEQAQGVKR
jgi:hypothetical protein